MPGQPNRGMMRGKRPAKMAPPFAKGDARTLECARKGAALGGKARAEQLARFKSLREAAEALRDVQCLNPKKFPNTSNGVATIMAMYAASQAGDSKAANFLANLMGEMVEKVDVQNLPVLRDDIPRAPDPKN